MSIALRLFIVLAAMIGFLCTMVVTHANHRAHGREVVLDMEPVDPRDLLLGYYSVIRTEAHELDMAEYDGPRTGWQSGDPVFAILEETETGSWAPVAISKEQPQGGLYLQGRVSWLNSTQDWEPDPDGEPNTYGRWPQRPVPGSEREVLRVSYNLERYYADKAGAAALDEMRQQARLRLIVSLDDNGNGVIKGLEIDGERRIDRILEG